jgi:hypothetical protein
MFPIHQPPSAISKNKMILSITISPPSRRRPADPIELYRATIVPHFLTWQTQDSTPDFSPWKLQNPKSLAIRVEIFDQRVASLERFSVS